MSDVIDFENWLRRDPEGRRVMPDYFASPDDWRSQLIYFLLPDRFNDSGAKTSRSGLLDRDHVSHAVPPGFPLTRLYWNLWALSGRSRFQGGTIRGIIDQLGYLDALGVTALWVGPVWKQRALGVDVNVNCDGTDDPWVSIDPADFTGPAVDYSDEYYARDDYHGYAVQDFVHVDPRFGTEQDLCDLVSAAHARGIRVIFDMLINHSGENWVYAPPSITQSPGRPGYVENRPDHRYDFGAWLDAGNQPLSPGAKPSATDDGVWPEVLQDPAHYSRRGRGNYGVGDLGDYNAEFRTSDYDNRDFGYPQNETDPDPILDDMVDIWSYWIALTDCDGFRVDTFKHVPPLVGADFSRRIRVFAQGLGKADFLIAGEVGGTDRDAATFIDSNTHVLSLDQHRRDLRALAAGDPGVPADRVLLPTVASLNPTEGAAIPALTDDALIAGIVTSIDDHDDLGIDPQRRLAAQFDPDSVVPAIALLLFGPGVPSLYYGTEQALGIPIGYDGITDLFPGFGHSAVGGDRYLREALFGPSNPRPSGPAGRNQLDVRDTLLPGFGPFASVGKHLFDETSPWYLATAQLAAARKCRPALQLGSISLLKHGRPVGGGTLADPLPDGWIAWTRRLGDSAAVVVIRTRASTQQASADGDLDLRLPDDFAEVELEGLATVSGVSPAVEPLPSGTTVVEPQTRFVSLALRGMKVGEVRVFATP